MDDDLRHDIDAWGDEPLPALPADLPEETVASLRQWRDAGLGLPSIPKQPPQSGRPGRWAGRWWPGAPSAALGGPVGWKRRGRATLRTAGAG